MATLSYAADLGLGQPMAHCMRQTVVALRLAGLAGASDRELEATYYLGLMMNVYCHADAAEQAKWFGDEISLKGDGFEMLDMSTARMVFFILRRIWTAPASLEAAMSVNCPLSYQTPAPYSRFPRTLSAAYPRSMSEAYPHCTRTPSPSWRSSHHRHPATPSRSR